MTEPPTIEHDPGEFRRPLLIAIWSARITLALMLAISFVSMTYFRMYPGEKFDLWNVPFVLLWLFLMVWLIVPGIPSVDGDSVEGARKSLAFRLGKKLNRILHHRNRNAAIRDETGKLGH